MKTGCSVVTTNRISVAHLEEMLIKQYNQYFNENASEEQLELSREDITFMGIMKGTTEMKKWSLLHRLTLQRRRPCATKYSLCGGTAAPGFEEEI